MRDYVDDVMMALGKPMEGIPSVPQAEAHAVLFGLRYALDAGRAFVRSKLRQIA